MHLLTTPVAWYRTWPSIVSDLHNYSNASRRPQRAMQTELLCKRPLTTYNLYRERNNCSTMHIAKATNKCVFEPRLIASFTWSSPQNECQLIDVFYSLLVASICCHRGRHRCNTVIHACLQPTRGLCLKADLKFCVRPSGARLCPQHIAKDCCLLR